MRYLSQSLVCSGSGRLGVYILQLLSPTLLIERHIVFTFYIRTIEMVIA